MSNIEAYLEKISVDKKSLMVFKRAKDDKQAAQALTYLFLEKIPDVALKCSDLIATERLPLMQYKFKVVRVLFHHIDEDALAQVVFADSKNKVRNILKELKDCYELLQSCNIKFSYPKEQKKNKNKKKQIEFYDRSISSLKPIYTPMGNKR